MEFHTQVVDIDGMHCDACVRRVSQALGNLPSIRVVSVEVGQARVLAEPSCESHVREALERAGFTMKGMHALK